MSDRSVSGHFAANLGWRHLKGRLFVGVCASLASVGLIALIVLIGGIVHDGWDWISVDFLRHDWSTLLPESSGVRSALWGSIWVVGLTGIFSVPVGIGAAVYLEEFAPDNRLTRFIHLNISNLAGVPSIVYGLLGLTAFVRWCRLDRSVISGGLTLSLLVLPVIIIASREALIAVPQSFRQAAYALGSTRWQTVRSHVLPVAMPGIMTGIILALSRAIGEAAPLIMIGAITYLAFVPDGLRSAFTVLPIQIYVWCEQPESVYQNLAAAASIVLLGVLIPMNAIAMLIRAWQQRKKAW